MKIIQNILIDGKHQKPIVTDVFFQENSLPKPIVIFCHGYKGFKDWGAWNLVAKEFAKDHFFFVKFNFSHNGGTVKNPIDFPDLNAFGNNNYTIELDDLGSVIQWVLNNDLYQKEIDTAKVYLIGHSRGGGIVTLKSAENKHISKVVSWAGVSNFANRFPKNEALKQWEKDGVFYVINARTQQQMPHYFQYYQDFKHNEKRLTIKTAVKKLTIPHLIIHGTTDESVAVDEAHQLHVWNLNSELFLIENTNHTFGINHPYNSDQLSAAMNAVVEKTKKFLSNKKEDKSPL
ncbi:MAG: alpha/beta fold hydrolase [Flavobacteriaceae bacterium]|jgi:pimeloyl-ACP methyl ester carboxylesterase|nr:alpha/beta fold hydrolase [Flavobacteriaceae bacterium]